MKAHEGDVLRFTGRTVGAPEHRATVVKVLGHDGEAPCRVRYEDGTSQRSFPALDVWSSPVRYAVPHPGSPAASGSDRLHCPR
ncbi:DUF1918 domain-containing protein [Streptomyces sp. NPDC012637]|uniref:DUF1918 domain-containing protein n=1 Tax=Streptomyces sp. NPDC012637 TaxID=3364842 RepID=UPI0036EFDA95